ncbi:MAG: hypothetical protein Fur0041_07330 [Bacteroidia bacterium]
MNRLFLSLLLYVSLLPALFAQGRGGYAGKKIIIGGGIAYSPFFTSITDFATRYNFQYGANAFYITGRYSQLGFTYDRFSLTNNHLFKDLPGDENIQNTQIGITYRMFRQNRGGLAPIGKFFDISLGYLSSSCQAKYVYSWYGTSTGDASLKSTLITGSVAFGTQGLCYDVLLLNTGVRMGTPLYLLSDTTGSEFGAFMTQRIMMKDLFSVFFGASILL